MKEFPAKDNQRTRLTKRLLRESMLELLRQKSIRHITVKELCEHSELNRSTFYAYYCDVEELHQEMGNELVNALLNYVQTMCDMGNSQVEPMLAYIKEHCEAFCLLIYNGQYMDIEQPLQRRIFDETLSKITLDGIHYSDLEKEYLMQYMFMGGSGIIHRWVQNDCDLSAQEAATLIGKLTSAVLISL